MIEFPPYRVDLDEERIWNGTRLLSLRRKPFAILRYLIANPSRLVTQDELVGHVWGGAVVSESAVRSHLHELRQVLGDGVIETVIGRGYRFVAPLREAARPTTAAATRRDRIVVGRAGELDTLRAAWARADAGRRQVCFVTGHPGIGKTTLVESFIEELTERGVVCASGQCIEQFGAPEPYLAIIAALRALHASVHGPRVVAALVRYAPTVLAHVPQIAPDDRIDDILRRAQGASEAKLVRELLEGLDAICATEPLVLVLEDMQWSDVSTIDLLAHLGQRSERARLLVIVTARSGDVQATQHPMNRVMRSLITRSGAAHVALDRVATDAVVEYIASRFERHTFPAAFPIVVERITEGTPLFMVSLVDDLVERGMIVDRDGVWSLAVSVEDIAAHRTDSVRQLIDVQLDRLTLDEQRVLEAASQIGIDFASGLVAAALEKSEEAVDDVCDSLARRGLFLVRDASEEWPDGSVQARYRVTHGLVQEVAHERCALARRQLWHRSIARRLETAWGEKSVEIAHALALHYDRGGAPALAIAQYLAAADRDARRFAIANSQALLGRARELTARLPANTERDRLALRILQGTVVSVIRASSDAARDPLAVFEEMKELAERIEDKVALVTALANVVMRLCTLSEYTRATAVLAQLDALLSTVTISDELHGFVEVARGMVLYWRGDHAASLPVLEAASRRRGEIDHAKFGLVSPTDQATIMHIYLGYLYWILGDDERFRAEAYAVLAAARDTGDPYGIGVALCAVARVHVILGGTIAEIEEPAREAASLLGAESVKPIAELMLGCAQRRVQPLDASTAASVLAALRTRTAMYPMGKTMLALLVVDALLGTPENEKLALELVEEMIAFARERDERFGESELVRTRGELLERRDPDAARQSYVEAIELASAAGAHGSLRRARARLDKL
ncbi:MAG: AAA family ATPase [Kofleriaceae bacterium]